MIKNYFVCIGAQKAGTTWLAAMLSHHPDLFMTPVKELHYFDHIQGITSHLSDRKRRSRYRKYLQKTLTQWHRFSDYKSQWSWYRNYMKDPIDDDWYCNLFDLRGSAFFAGEATPEYAIIGEKGFRQIQKLAPDARIIFVMRNPVSQAWSQALHHCRSNRLKVADQSFDTLVNLLQSERFRNLSNYQMVLNNLGKVFATEQICVKFYEDIHTNRRAELSEIVNFIGAEDRMEVFPDLSRRFNFSQKAEMPEDIRHHLQQTYRDMAGEIEHHMKRLPKSWSDEFAT